LLQAVDVSFAYPGRANTLALNRVSLEVRRGEVVGLLGPNGSGKTTLVRILCGLLQPHSGAVSLEGQPLARFRRRDLARRLALVPQETRTAFDFAVLDIALMGRYPHLGPFALEGPRDVEIARDALEATGTLALAARSFTMLSGGEKQRVVIAGALAQEAGVLLLDEPTTSLDLGYQLEITALLRRLNADRGTTMLVSTHDLNLVASLCTRIVLLKSGRVLAQGRTDRTLTSANISALYGVEADVQFHARAGHLTVVPIARSI
jgi:iron complex transport system ATP-binding protein